MNNGNGQNIDKPSNGKSATPGCKQTNRAERPNRQGWWIGGIICLLVTALIGLGVRSTTFKVRPPAGPFRSEAAAPPHRETSFAPQIDGCPPLLEMACAPTSVPAAPASISSSPLHSPPARHDESALPEFDAWITSYFAASAEKPALEPAGRILAVRRRQYLEQFIQTDPAASLTKAVPLAVRQNLPPSVQEQLEERVSGMANLDVIATLGHGDDASGKPVIKRYATVNGRRYRAFVYGRRLSQVTQSSLPIHGMAVGDVLAIHEDPVRPLEPGELSNTTLPVANAEGRCPVSAAPVDPFVAVDVGGQVFHLCAGEHAQLLNQSLGDREDLGPFEKPGVLSGPAQSNWTTGVKTVLFMRVNFVDQAPESISSARAAQLMQEVNEFYQANSFQLTSMQATVTPLLTLPATVSWYAANEMALLADARRVAAAAGYNTYDYDLDCVFCGSSFALNQAFIGGRGVWLSRGDAGTAAHEFGHNLGLYHANAWATSDGTSIGLGKNREYGNDFDTMGYGFGSKYSFNAFEKHQLNWLPEQAVRLATTNGTFRLSAIDAPTVAEGSICALQIPKDSQRNYWIEMRQVEADPQLRNGILLTWSPWAESNGGSQLINCNPQQPGQQALRIGQTFYDLDIGLKILPLEYLHEPNPAVDVEVKQVYFVPAEIPLSQDSLAASSTGNPQILTAAGSCQITIPADDTYYFWVQADGSGWQFEVTSIPVQDEAGQSGTAQSDAGLGHSVWTLVKSPGSNAAKVFSLSQGVHTIRLQGPPGSASTVRLLVTNDGASNLPPVLSGISDQVVLAGSSLTVPFFMAGVGQSPTNVSVRVSCNNPSLLPSTNLILTAETSGQFTLTIRTERSALGEAAVVLSATDLLGRVFNQSFKLQILGLIQNSIANAPSGSTVRLSAGTHYDNIVIDKDLTLEGAGAAQTILNGRGEGITLTISSNRNVTLKGLTIQNGRLAGVRNFGTLRISSSLVSQNAGSGIENRGTLTMEDSVLQNNRAGTGGGLNNSGWASLRDFTVVSNVANGAAGGILNGRGATLTLENGSVIRNKSLAGNGGGIQNFGEMTLRNCTLAHNISTQLATSDPNRPRSSGGAVFNSGQLALQNCTICWNQSYGNGGGIDNRAIANLSNSILAGNTTLEGSASNASGKLTSGGHNLIQDMAGCTLTGELSNNILGQDPLLAEADNGGDLSEAVVLQPGSPAIDAGDCSTSTRTDQRGAPRPTGMACDIGAFEFQRDFLIVREASGAHRFQAELQPDVRYTVEVSTDLVNWGIVESYMTTSSGLLEFIDPDTTPVQSRFYRVRPAEAHGQ